MKTTRGTVRRWKPWLFGGLAAALVVAVGGPFAYIHLVEGKAPAPLTLSGSTSPSSSASTGGTANSGSGSADGTWNVATGSVVGYRVQEVLFGQSNEAVGRTSSITGSMSTAGTKIIAAGFSVDMTTVASDQSRRDDQFNGRIMETATYPTASFKLTKPIDLGSIPAVGVRKTFEATGDLTLHGVTKSVIFQVTGQRTSSGVQIVGSIPITFSDWNISNPSFGPVTTEDHGVLEFSLNLTKA